MLLKLILLAFIFIVYNVATRKFEITYVVYITFLLDCADLRQPASPREGGSSLLRVRSQGSFIRSLDRLQDSRVWD